MCASHGEPAISSSFVTDLAHLRRQDVLANLYARDQIRTAARGALAAQQFLEVDTPVLGERINEYVAQHVRAETADGTELWLAQSPQLYKQALIASGIERYFQLSHCFRDEVREPGRTDYLREFIQIDAEMTATTVDEVMAVAEKLVRAVFETVGRPLPAGPIHRMNYAEAIAEYGNDKPDLRDGSGELACVWVVSFPMATPGPNGELILERHPMAMPATAPASPGDLLSTTSQSFDLVINGYEIASGDLRIHNGDLQRAVLIAAGIDPGSFDDLLTALEDCPPHGGFGIGLDRLTMQLLGADSVAAVTAFPHGFGA